MPKTRAQIALLIITSAMVTKLRSGRKLSNKNSQLSSQGRNTSSRTNIGSPLPPRQQHSRSTPQSTASSKSDADTDLDVHLTSPVRRTRPVARLCCYEKGLPKHLLKELLQDINAVGGFNSPRYSLADLRHANRDSYGDAGLRKQVENQVYRWKDFNQEQWTTLLDQYGLLRAPCTSTPAKATSEESEAVLASPVFTSRKTKWKTQPPHQTLCSPFLSSNNTPSMSSLALSMPAQMLAKYESGDYSKFGACLFSNLA